MRDSNRLDPFWSTAICDGNDAPTSARHPGRSLRCTEPVVSGKDHVIRAPRRVALRAQGEG